MIFQKNSKIIKTISKKLFFAYKSDSTPDDPFYRIVIPVMFETDNERVRDLKKIQVLFYSDDVFSEDFSNIYNSKNKNFYMLEKLTEMNSLFGEDPRKNMLTSYGRKKTESESNKIYEEEIKFDNSSFVTSDSAFKFARGIKQRIVTSAVFGESTEVDGKNHVFIENVRSFESLYGVKSFYLIKTSTIQSRYIIDNNITAIRIIALDSSSNIIDDSGFIKNINFSRVIRDYAIIDNDVVHTSELKNKLNNINISFFKGKKSRSSLDSYDISTNLNFHGYEHIFNNYNISLSYTANDGSSITLSSKDVGFDEKHVFYEKNNSMCREFINKIAYDSVVNNATSFPFDISIKLDYDIEKEVSKTKIQNKNSLIREAADQSINFSTRVIYDLNNSFIRSIITNLRNNVYSNVFKEITFSQQYRFVNSTIIECKVKLEEYSFNNDFLKNLKVIAVIQNEKYVTNIYKNQNFILENKINYKNKTFRNLFENNEFVFYLQPKTKTNKFSIEFKLFESFNYKLENKTIEYSPEYENSINIANKLFKKNLKIKKIDINTNLDLNTKSIFDFGDFFIENLQDFKDIAFNYGYIDQATGLGNVKLFLENCAVKIENTTKINNINFKTHKSTYQYLSNLCNISNIEANNFVMSKSNILNVKLKTDDYYNIVSIKKSNINKNIVDFFTIKNKETKQKKLQLQSEFYIINNLYFYFIPIPYIISKYKGRGLDDLSNPIVENPDYSPEKIESDKKELSRTLINYIYSGSENLNVSKYDKFVELLMSSDFSDNIYNYKKLFDFLIETKINQSNTFFNIKKMNIQDLMNLTGFEKFNKFKNSDLVDYYDQNLENNFFNLSKNLSNFYIESTFPYKILFENQKYKNNNYNFEKLSFVKNTNIDTIRINIEYLKDLYNETEILNIFPTIRVSCFYLINNTDSNFEYENLSQNIKVIDVNEKKYCIYSKNYIEEESRKSEFNNFNVGLPSTSYNVLKDNDSYYIDIDIQKAGFDFNSSMYCNIENYIDELKSNNINNIDNVLIRFSISFEIKNKNNEVDYYLSNFNHILDKVNLNNTNIIIDRFNSITQTLSNS